MRLWHYELIPFLPKSQLLAQWRELNSIFKKQDKHILINYIYEYSKEHLRVYSDLVLYEMAIRGWKDKSIENYKSYFRSQIPFFAWEEKFFRNTNPFPDHHTDRYLLQCFYNLQEKFDRGQKDFDRDTYDRLERFVKERFSDKDLLKERIC